METKKKKNSRMEKILDVMIWVLFPFSMTHAALVMRSPEQEKIRKEKEVAKEKALFRNFRMEVKSGFWGNKISFTQREKPLTDEEMELMYKDEK